MGIARKRENKRCLLARRPDVDDHTFDLPETKMRSHLVGGLRRKSSKARRASVLGRERLLKAGTGEGGRKWLRQH